MAPAHLLAHVDASGLRGHGGAWFPVGEKWRSVLAGGRRAPVVVANGAEGEPASAKDGWLLTHEPHLVLDGAAAATRAVGARRVVVYVPRRLVTSTVAAIEERRRAGIDAVSPEVVVAPDAFLSGQESAAVRVIDGGAPVPSFTGLISVREQGVRGRPTLVHNVETLAHLGLVAAWVDMVPVGRY